MSNCTGGRSEFGWLGMSGLNNTKALDTVTENLL